MKKRRGIIVHLRHPRACEGGRLWRALAESLAWEIDVGRLAPGQRVPATRALARQLGVSRTTVALAYEELASLGYLRPRTGDGTYVTFASQRLRPPLFKRRWQRRGDPDGNLLMLIR